MKEVNELLIDLNKSFSITTNYRVLFRVLHTQQYDKMYTQEEQEQIKGKLINDINNTKLTANQLKTLMLFLDDHTPFNKLAPAEQQTLDRAIKRIENNK